jgi:hypothetical protein
MSGTSFAANFDNEVLTEEYKTIDSKKILFVEGGGGHFFMLDGKVHFVDMIRGRFGPARLPYKNLEECAACTEGCGVKTPIYKG